MNMKKLLLASTLMLSGSAMAAGFYAGGLVGGVSHQFNTNEADPDNGAGVLGDGVPQKNSGGVQGFVFGVYGGYQFDLINDFFVAAEIDASIDTSHGKYESNRATMTYRSLTPQHTIGLYALPGFHLSDKVDVYGRLGVAQTQFEYKAAYDVANEQQMSKKETDALATVIGLGMKYQFHDMLAFRFDYRYSMYAEFKAIEEDKAPMDPVTGDSYLGTNKVNASSQSFNVGVEYIF